MKILTSCKRENISFSLINKVLQEEKIPGEAPLVKALTAVLTASQRYMRDQTVGEACVQTQLF